MKLGPMLLAVGQTPSHPARVRGLKHCLLDLYCRLRKSHPARVRGLKQSYKTADSEKSKVAPARVRGLKLGHKSIKTTEV